MPHARSLNPPRGAFRGIDPSPTAIADQRLSALRWNPRRRTHRSARHRLDHGSDRRPAGRAERGVAGHDPLDRLGLLALVAFLSGFVVAIWRAPVGFVAAILAGLSATLLLWLMRTYLLEGGPYNRLIFGPSGFITVPLASTVGGVVAHLLDDNRLHARFAFPAIAGSACGRHRSGSALRWPGRLIGRFSVAPAIDNALAGEIIGVLVSMLLAAFIVARYGQANGISFGDWQYRWTPSTMLIGAAAVSWRSA